MKKDDYVQIVFINGNYRYGYISEILERGSLVGISLSEEGESKIAFDAARDTYLGKAPADYVSILTDVEKRIVPLLSKGHNTNRIADELSISPVTVRAHLRTLRIKLHLDDRAQLIAFSQALNTMIEEEANAR